MNPALNDSLRNSELTVPTLGLNVEKYYFNDITFQTWDLGGQSSFRAYWSCYYDKVDAIIFVIDTSDKDRLDIVKSEYVSILKVTFYSINFYYSSRKRH